MLRSLKRCCVSTKQSPEPSVTILECFISVYRAVLHFSALGLHWILFQTSQWPKPRSILPGKMGCVRSETV